MTDDRIEIIFRVLSDYEVWTIGKVHPVELLNVAENIVKALDERGE